MNFIYLGQDSSFLACRKSARDLNLQHRARQNSAMPTASVKTCQHSGASFQQLSTALKETQGMVQFKVVMHICNMSHCLKLVRMVDHRISPLSSGRNGFHRVQGRQFRSLPGLQLPQKASSQENEGKKKKGGKETKTTEVSKREVKG